MKHILIVGSPDDPHVARVVARLKQEPEIAPQIVDPNVPANYAVSEGPTGGVRLAIDDWSYDAASGQPLICWWRDKTQERLIDSAEIQAEVWGWRERRALLTQALFAAGARFVNDPGARRPAHDKLLQLRAAREVGFSCPASLITSDRQQALAFVEQHRAVIMKPLATGGLPGSHALGFPAISIPVCRVTAEELSATDPADFAAGPVVLQPELGKKYEVRSLAFGRDVRSFRIDSQASQRGQLDWRLASRENIFSAMGTPARIVDLCGAYLKYVGLNAGSFDFVVDAEDRWWFLECNPEGQWGWLEGDDHDLSIFFADKLLGMLGRQGRRMAPTNEGHERFVAVQDLVEHVAAQRRAVYFLSLKDCMPCAQVNQHLALLEDYAMDGFTVFGTTAQTSDPEARAALTKLGVNSFPMTLLVDGGVARPLRCFVMDETLRFSDPVTKAIFARIGDFAASGSKS